MSKVPYKDLEKVLQFIFYIYIDCPFWVYWRWVITCFKEWRALLFNRSI